MAANGQSLDPHVVAAKVKTLINEKLKIILKEENLPVSGVKNALQSRIIARKYWRYQPWSFLLHHKTVSDVYGILGLEYYARRNDTQAFEQLKNLIIRTSNGLNAYPSLPTPPGYATSTSPYANYQNSNMAGGPQYPVSNGATQQSLSSGASNPNDIEP